MTVRADFLRAASARRHGTAGLLLQGRERRDGTDALRVGFTCSRKLGNAVARNRAKRRLRAVARAVLTSAGRPGWDYVLVGRPSATATRGFADLLADLATALDRIHAQGQAHDRGQGGRAGRGGKEAPRPGGAAPAPPLPSAPPPI